MKKIFITLFLLVSLYINAQQYTYVRDNANVISNDQQIENIVRNSIIKTRVFTTQSLNGENIDDFSNALFGKANFGRNDFLIVLAINERKTATVTHKSMSHIFTENIKLDIRESAIPYFKNRDFDGGVLEMVNRVNRIHLTTNTPENNHVNDGVTTAPPIKQQEATTQVTVNQVDKSFEESKGVTYILIFGIFAGIAFLVYRHYKQKEDEAASLEELRNKYLNEYKRLIDTYYEKLKDVKNFDGSRTFLSRYNQVNDLVTTMNKYKLDIVNVNKVVEEVNLFKAQIENYLSILNNIQEYTKGTKYYTEIGKLNTELKKLEQFNIDFGLNIDTTITRVKFKIENDFNRINNAIKDELNSSTVYDVNILNNKINRLFADINREYDSLIDINNRQDKLDKKLKSFKTKLATNTETSRFSSLLNELKEFNNKINDSLFNQNINDYQKMLDEVNNFDSLSVQYQLEFIDKWDNMMINLNNINKDIANYNDIYHYYVMSGSSLRKYYDDKFEDAIDDIKPYRTKYNEVDSFITKVRAKYQSEREKIFEYKGVSFKEFVESHNKLVKSIDKTKRSANNLHIDLRSINNSNERNYRYNKSYNSTDSGFFDGFVLGMVLSNNNYHSYSSGSGYNSGYSSSSNWGGSSSSSSSSSGWGSSSSSSSSSGWGSSSSSSSDWGSSSSSSDWGSSSSSSSSDWGSSSSSDSSSSSSDW